MTPSYCGPKCGDGADRDLTPLRMLARSLVPALEQRFRLGDRRFGDSCPDNVVIASTRDDATVLNSVLCIADNHPTRGHLLAIGQRAASASIADASLFQHNGHPTVVVRIHSTAAWLSQINAASTVN